MHYFKIKLITFITIKTSNFENQATKNRYEIFKKSLIFFVAAFAEIWWKNDKKVD